MTHPDRKENVTDEQPVEANEAEAAAPKVITYPHTYTLLEPIQVTPNATPVLQLKFRKPMAKDMRDLPLDPSFGNFLDIASKLSGNPKAIIDGMSAPDTMAVVGLMGEFMEAGQPTGPTA